MGIVVALEVAEEEAFGVEIVEVVVVVTKWVEGKHLFYIVLSFSNVTYCYLKI